MHTSNTRTLAHIQLARSCFNRAQFFAHILFLRMNIHSYTLMGIHSQTIAHTIEEPATAAAPYRSISNGFEWNGMKANSRYTEPNVFVCVCAQFSLKHELV